MNSIFLSYQISQQYFQPWFISQTSPNEQDMALILQVCPVHHTKGTGKRAYVLYEKNTKNYKIK